VKCVRTRKYYNLKAVTPPNAGQGKQPHCKRTAGLGLQKYIGERNMEEWDSSTKLKRNRDLGGVPMYNRINMVSMGKQMSL